LAGLVATNGPNSGTKIANRETETMMELTFDDVRRRSNNGDRPVIARIHGHGFTCAASVRGRKARIDFDLFLFNYDLAAETCDALRAEYHLYCNSVFTKRDFQRGVCPVFTKTNMICTVNREDADYWFKRLSDVLGDDSSLVSIQ
jgi:hypothetical protein